jgi:VWFA-related protein
MTRLAAALPGDGGADPAQQQLPDAPMPQLGTIPSSLPPQTAPAPPAQNTGETPLPNPEIPNPDSVPPGPPPNHPIPSVKPGNAPDLSGSGRDELITFSKDVSFVLWPVTVKRPDGQLVVGLLQKDFSIYEDGVKQNVTFFTSDPFPLSAAVVLDLGLPEIAWRRIRETLPALVGAFSQFDEVALYTYANTVQQVQDFSGVNGERIAASLRTLKNRTGQEGVPVLGGPMSGQTPSINGVPVNPQTPQVATMPRESYVLNDAILRAAVGMGSRGATRRKVIFVISDGRELGSSAGYNDVLKVLLSRQISVYAIDVNGGGIPGYRRLERIRIPGQGYGDVLPKYASATGGQLFAEVSESSIEQTYARVTGEARNQYTIGYNTPQHPSAAYRSVEVRVDRPNLRVYARDGYYPLPPVAK